MSTNSSFATTFLSHSTVDKPLVDAVATELCRRGVIPWLDKHELAIGLDLSESLREAIRRQVSVTLFLSSQALGSAWVRDELREALDVEMQGGTKNWILPIYLGDPLPLVRDSDLLRSRWLHADGNRVDRLGFSVKSYDSQAPKQVAAEVADAIARSMYLLMQIESSSEINLVLDQRGAGRRTGLYRLPENVSRQGRATLVFRPDLGLRSSSEVLHGEAWQAMARTMRRALAEALGTLRTPRIVRVLGDGQSGLAFLLGLIFDRTTLVDLFCYNAKGTVFTNQGQDRQRPLKGGNPHCETTEDMDAAAPTTIPEHHQCPELALYVGPRDYLGDVREHLESESRLPLVFIAADAFGDSRQVMDRVRDIIALLRRFKEEHGTQHLRLYNGLPINAIPLLAANLTHVVEGIDFMEYRRDLQGTRASAEQKYIKLSMTP